MSTSSQRSRRHAAASARFGEIIEQVTDWSAPTPVPEWSAGEVVHHLLEWPVDVFRRWGELDLETDAGTDLTVQWRARTERVQAVLDSADRADRLASEGPFVGASIAQIIDMIYTPDVFMHAIDLARSAGVQIDLDQDYAAEILAGMREMGDYLRESGQYGPAYPTDSSDPVLQLSAFIGRDPQWVSATHP